jgi:hypothetical protein
LPNDCFVSFFVNHRPIHCLVDTGAVHSCISLDKAKHLKLSILPVENDVNLVTADKTQIVILGYVEVNLCIQGLIIPQCLFVLKQLSNPILLGNDFLRNTSATISYADRMIDLYEGLVKAPLTYKNGKQSVARLSQTVHIPPWTEMITTVRIPKQFRYITCLLETNEPLKSKQLLVANSVIEPKNQFSICRICNFSQKTKILRKNMPVACISELNLNDPVNKAMLSVDLNDKNIVNTPQREASTIENDQKKKILEQIGLTFKNDNLTGDQQKQLIDLLFHYKEIFCKDYDALLPSNLPPVSLKMKDTRIIRQKQYPLSYQHEIALEKITDKLLEAGIVRESNSPFNSPAIIVKKKSFDPQNPSNISAFRLVLDYRKINSLLVSEFQPLSTTESIFNQIAEAKPLFFSCFDWTSGFYQIPLTPESSHLTAFSTKTRHLEFTRTPQGLKTSPAHFLANIYTLFRKELQSNLSVYVDDGLVYSQTFPEHLQLLETIFKKLQQAQLRINPLKSEFAKDKLQFLAYEFNQDGMRIDESRFDKIRNIQPPKNVKQLKAIYGFFNYFRKYCYKYSILTSPWRDLLKEGTRFQWSQVQQDVLDKLKAILLQRVVLFYPQMSQTFYLQTDACKVGIAYSLWQKSQGQFRPIAFGGRALRNYETSLSATDSELLAILEGVTHFRSFLSGPLPFVILSDNISLKYIHTLKHSASPKLIRYALLLQNLNFEIEHIPGRLNVVLDFFSRYPTQDTNDIVNQSDPLLDVDHYNYLNAIEIEQLVLDNDCYRQKKSERKHKYKLYTLSTLTPVDGQSNAQTSAVNIQHDENDEFHSIIQQTHADMQSQFQAIITLESQAENDIFHAAMIRYLQFSELPAQSDVAKKVLFQSQDYFIKDGKLIHLGRLSKRARLTKILPRYEQLVIPQQYKKIILENYHNLFHFSGTKGYLSARTKFFWHGQCTDFYEYAKSCDVCLQIRSSRPTNYERHPLPLNPTLFGSVQFDFHSVLMSKRSNCQAQYKHVFVIVDQLSQHAHLVPTRDQLANTAAEEIFKYILKYGVFKNVVSDRSSTFLNQTFQALLKMPGMEAVHYKTSPFFPQTNGLTENLNKNIIKILRAHCQDQENFHKYLPVIECAINTSFNASLGCTPHFVLYGQEYRSPIDSIMGNEPVSVRPFNVPAGLSFIEEQLSLLRKLIHQQVLDHRAYEKKQHDKTVTRPEYQIGQRVYLRQIFDKTHNNMKHSPLFSGPYVIVDIKNSVLVRLQHFNTGKILRNWINTVHILPSRDERRQRMLERIGVPGDNDGNGTFSLMAAIDSPTNAKQTLQSTDKNSFVIHTDDPHHGPPIPNEPETRIYETGSTHYNDQQIAFPRTAQSESSYVFSTAHDATQNSFITQSAISSQTPATVVTGLPERKMYYSLPNLAYPTDELSPDNLPAQTNGTTERTQNSFITGLHDDTLLPTLPRDRLCHLSQDLADHTDGRSNENKLSRETTNSKLNPLAMPFQPINYSASATSSPQRENQIHLQFTSLPTIHKDVEPKIVKITSMKCMNQQRFGRVKYENKTMKPTYIEWSRIPTKFRVRYFIDRFQNAKIKRNSTNSKSTGTDNLCS